MWIYTLIITFGEWQFDSITDLIKQDFQDRMMGLFEANVELSNFITIEAVKVSLR